MNKNINFILKAGTYCILAFIVKLLFHAQGFIEGFKTDTLHHLVRIMPIINGEYYLPHSMFHYLTYGLFKLCNLLSIKTSLLDIMVWLETIFVILMVEIIHRILKYFLINKYSSFTLLIISISLIFVISIYMPFFNEFYYMGQWGPNTWHNPTTFLIKPIALLCIIGMYLFITGNVLSKSKYFVILLSALFVLGIWAKPSFAITFYPALFIFLLLFYTKDYKRYLKIFFILLPSVIFLIIQFLKTYFTELDNTSDLKDNIVLTFFGVTNYYSNNAFISLLLAIAFPLSVVILDFKNVFKNKILMLVWLNTIIAFLQSSFLAEKFKFEQAAFAFGYNLALFFLFIFSIIHFLDYIRLHEKKKERISAIVMLMLYFVHLYAGIYYYFHYLITKDFS